MPARTNRVGVKVGVSTNVVTLNTTETKKAKTILPDILFNESESREGDS